VQLYVYDLTQGMARQLSPMFLGKQIDGVWHTAIVINGIETFYGYGIQQTRAGQTPFGRPLQVITIGYGESAGCRAHAGSNVAQCRTITRS
jgi:desumoylating isopeptidase 1